MPIPADEVKRRSAQAIPSAVIEAVDLAATQEHFCVSDAHAALSVGARTAMKE